MPTRLVIAMGKGGVAKTTTTISLAHGLVNKGKRVLVVDTDTQGHVSRWLGVEAERGFGEWMTTGDIGTGIVEARPNMWVIPGGLSVADARYEISRYDDAKQVSLIAAYLASAESSFDYVIIDTSPGWDPLMHGVLVYSDFVVCPVRTEAPLYAEFVDFFNRLTNIWQENGRPVLRYIVPTVYDARTVGSKRVLELLQENFSPLVCDPISQCVDVGYAASSGQSIYEFDPKSRAARDYEKLVERVIADGR